MSLWREPLFTAFVGWLLGIFTLWKISPLIKKSHKKKEAKDAETEKFRKMGAPPKE